MRGIVVRSRSVIGNIGAALQTIVGGITIYTNLCERARQDAFAALCQHAVEQGANAVIGVRYDATEVMQRGHGDAVLWDSGADRKSDVRGNGPAQVRCLSCRSQSPNSDCQSRDFELERSHIRRIPSL